MNASTNFPAPGRPVYLVDGLRTPYLKVRGGGGPFHAADLAVAAGRALLLRQRFQPADLDEVVFGCVAPGPDEANIGRIIALRLGCGHRVPGWTVQRNCASGLQAIDSAAQAIALGRSDLVLAGGTEAMSYHPVLYNTAMVSWLAESSAARSVWARLRLLARLRPSHFKPVVGLLRGLTDPVVGLTMGQTAEELATRFGIDRGGMDAFALRSHQRLARAVEDGSLAPEIVPLYDRGRSFERDDGLRSDSTFEALARLRPVFDRPHGRVTAGNSAQVTDGAACLLLASEEGLLRHGLHARARISGVSWSGLDPAQMGLGPAYAIDRLLTARGGGVSDIDYWEINEAFAAQVLACLHALGDSAFCREELGRAEPHAPIDPERLNVDGGAIAMGHPVGSSGARIVLHLLRTLERFDARRGVASLCIGGGQGGAVLIERETGGGTGEQP